MFHKYFPLHACGRQASVNPIGARIEKYNYALLLYLIGLMLFFASFFAPSVPVQMTSGEGRDAVRWESSTVTHIRLLAEPLRRVCDFVEALIDPSGYGYGQAGDEYESYVTETSYRFLYSIPASIGWLVIWASILLIRQLWHQSISHGPLQCIMTAGSIITLSAVPLLAIDFYKHATIYEGYFHLGVGAYLIVAAYLFTGIGILLMLLRNRLR
jgi:hypothetical protein